MSRLSLLPMSAALLAAVVVSAPAYADTGAVRGEVLDEGGLAVPGVRVTITGVNIAGELSAETDAEGHFRFPAVPPGVHEVTFSKDGFAPTRVSATVRLDETARIPVVLRSAVAGMEIVIEEQLPVIDSTRSAFSTQMDTELLQNLPIARSAEMAVNMLPGVEGRVDTQSGGPGKGAPSVRGEGGYGNNYLLDGISTRDPATKTSGVSVNFDAIQEIQVYTDGLPAEFSQATGMLVNVVTKDGGDEHFGAVGYWIDGTNDIIAPGTYDILNLETNQEEATDKRNSFKQELSLIAGGPLVQEKLWYMVGVDLQQGRTQFESMDPDTPYTAYDGQFFGKVTWFATPDLSLQYQAGAGGANIDNYETSGQYTPEAQGQYRSREFNQIATVRFTPGGNTSAELKLAHQASNIDVVPLSGQEDLAQVFDLGSSQYTGNYDSSDLNTRGRLGASFKITQLVDGFLGDHRFKVGAEYWRVTDSRYLQFSGPGDGVSYIRDEANGYDCTSSDGGVTYDNCYGYTEYVDVGDPLGHVGFVFGSFIQDDWQPVDRLTLNVGVRFDHERLFANDPSVAAEAFTVDPKTKVYSAFMPAPRLGLAWDITGDSKNVIVANYGRYYDISGTDFAAWGDTRSSFVYNEYRHNPDTGDYDLVWSQDPEANPLWYCNDIWRTDPDYGEVIDAACGGENLKPYHSDKMIVAYYREILPLFSLGVRGIWGATTNIPEDVDTDLDVWVITNPESKRRDYRALELVAQRKFDGKWQALASYTLSESKGHSPGQFELASGGQTGSDGNNVGVYLDDVDNAEVREGFFQAGYGWLLDGLAGLGTTSDDAGYYGYLPYHSFHKVKLSGSYTFDFGTTVGAVYEFDSGRAWQKRGYVDLYGDYFAFPEGRGSRFMPPVHYFDLRAAHAFKFGADKNKELEVTLDVFNVLGLAAPITYMENDIESFGMTLYRQAPRALRGGVRFTF